MKQLIAVALVFSLAHPAWPEEPAPPPPDGEVQEPPRHEPRAEQMGYYESCFGVPRVGQGPFVSGEVVVPISGGSTGGGSSAPVSSKLTDEKALLIVAVLAAVALPVVVYAIDNPAPRIVLQRFRCPTFTLDFLGGVYNGRTALGDGAAGFVSTRIGFGVGHVATEFQYEGGSGTVSAFSTHLLIRPTPREHIEGGLAIGYRRSVFDHRIQEGLEVGLPHRYALWRDELRTLALEVRPMLLLSSGVEPSLEAAFLIPLAQVMQLRIGGRAYTFEGNLRWGLSTGLSLTL
jgi:hypothetical protein